MFIAKEFFFAIPSRGRGGQDLYNKVRRAEAACIIKLAGITYYSKIRLYNGRYISLSLIIFRKAYIKRRIIYFTRLIYKKIGKLTKKFSGYLLMPAIRRRRHIVCHPIDQLPAFIIIPFQIITVCVKFFPFFS